jgi:signal peptide peptidase SppA
MQYRHIHVLSFLTRESWAILPEKMDEIMAFIELRMAGESVDFVAQAAPKSTTKNAVAVMPLFGIISQRMNLITAFSGGTSTELFTAQFREYMANPSVKSIVIDVASSGGGVSGIEELHTEIMAARGKKRVVAVANSMMASAAYWISSAAEEIVATPGAEVGSIGVRAVHFDYSAAYEKEGIKPTIIQAGKFKAEGNPYEPLGDEAKAFYQERADRYYESFLKAISSGRDVPVADVKKGYGQGRMLDARQAFDAGMVDRIGTLEKISA